MKHRIAGRKLSRGFRARRALFKSLAEALLLHGKIETTRARAKSIKGQGPIRMVNLGRRKGDNARLVRLELLEPEKERKEK